MKEIESIINFPQYLRAKMMRIVMEMDTVMPVNVNATLIMSMQKIVRIMDVSTSTVLHMFRQVVFGAGCMDQKITCVEKPFLHSSSYLGGLHGV